MSQRHCPAVSIIVPVYRAERTIGRCVDSLLNQTLRNIEIILVDDGSPDGSGAIIDEYAKRDSRVRVLHEKNSGVGTARNFGMSSSTGEYVGFVDADDWVLPSMYEILYDALQRTHADVAFTGYQEVRFGRRIGGFEQAQQETVLSNGEELFAYRRHFFGRGTDKNEPVVQGYVWDACFRRKFLDRWHLEFTNQMMEDMLFVLEACQRAAAIALVPGEPYRYRFGEEASRISTFKRRTIDDFREHLLATRKLIEREPVQFQAESQTRWNRQVIDSCRSLTHLIEASDFPHKEQQQYIQQIFSDPLLADACAHYDAHAFRLFDRLFFLCEKDHLVTPARCMMDAWVSISPLVHRIWWNPNR